jgi:hypothetical protein
VTVELGGVAPPRYRLELPLSADWRVVDPKYPDEDSDGVRSANATAIAEMNLIRAAEALDSDFAAVLALPITDSNGSILTILIASVVGLTIPISDIPEPDHPAFQFHVVDGVEVTPGRNASYGVVTYPVWSEDGQRVCLLTFSSPNLPYRALLAEGFRAILRHPLPERWRSSKVSKPDKVRTSCL